jgi:uncharacterized protein YciI
MKDEPERVARSRPSMPPTGVDLSCASTSEVRFADRSGGLVSFEADSHDDAARLVSDDPFVREGLVERSWVKEWKIE